MSRKQYKDLTEQEILKIASHLMHTVDEDKDVAEDHNTSTRVVRRIADEYGIDIAQRRNAIFLRNQYVWHFKEGGRIRYEAESQFRESVGPGLRKFWAEFEVEKEEEELLDSLEADGLLATDEPDASE